MKEIRGVRKNEYLCAGGRKIPHTQKKKIIQPSKKTPNKLTHTFICYVSMYLCTCVYGAR